MAGQPLRDPEIAENLQAYQVNQEQEADLMIRYIETTTRQLVFAIDLMDFVLSLSNLQLPDCTHPNCCERIGQSDFDHQMKRFIELFIAYKSKIGKSLTLEEIELMSYEQFKWFANTVAFETDAKVYGETLRYGTPTYWELCITIAKLCTTAYQHGMPNAPHFGIMLMCRTFSNFDRKSAFHPVHPWTWIKYVAYESCSKLEIEALGISRSLKFIYLFQ